MYDTFGIEILNQRLYQSIDDIKIESFIFNSDINEVNTVLLKFDEWISLFFDDGVLFIRDNFEIKKRIITSDGDIIEYRFLESLDHLIDKNKVLHSKLIHIEVDLVLGLRLRFDNHAELRINQQILGAGEFGQTLIEIK